MWFETREACLLGLKFEGNKMLQKPWPPMKTRSSFEKRSGRARRLMNTPSVSPKEMDINTNVPCTGGERGAAMNKLHESSLVPLHSNSLACATDATRVCTCIELGCMHV